MGAVRSCPECRPKCRPMCTPNRQPASRPEPVTADGLPAPLLRKKLHDANAVASATSLDLTDGHLDTSTARAVVLVLDNLAFQAVVTQACLISASTALRRNFQPNTRSPYEEIVSHAVECLQKVGDLYEAMLPSFEEHAYPLSGTVRSWSPHIVDVADGSCPPLKGYLNTFQSDRLSESGARQQAFAMRLQRFMEEGGSFDDVIELKPKTGLTPREVTEEELGVIQSGIQQCSSPSRPTPDDDGLSPSWVNFVPGQWYDYVITTDHVIRCYPSSPFARMDRPKCGHSLLVSTCPTSASDFKDDPVLMAGELCVLRGATDIDFLIVSNNSGHFKPRSIDLPNVLPAFAKAGVAGSKICLFAGPNNILALRRELAFAQGQSADDSAKFAGVDLLDPYRMVSSWERQR